VAGPDVRNPSAQGNGRLEGTVQLTLTYRLPWRFTSFSFYAQAFFGYNEALLHYNERTSVFRFGISFDDRFNWVIGEPGTVTRPPPPSPSP
jgi:hypothetical protein